ncbi:MAG: hypothetical protein KAI47_27695 [Deltaproteobacteria bacterium]|nr:hypothetical protein [Deltaproteobacteria bacterium]
MPLTRKIAMCIAACTVIFGGLLIVGLPALGAIPDDATWQRALYAIPAGLTAWFVFHLRYKTFAASRDPHRLLNVPVRIALGFSLGAALGVPLLAFIVHDRLLLTRPEVLLLGAPAIALAVTWLFHPWARRAVVTAFNHLLIESQLPSRPLSPPPRGARTMPLRRVLFGATLALAGIALVLTAIHTRSQERTIETQRRRRHLKTLAAICSAHLANLGVAQRATYVKTFPTATSHVMPVILSSEGRVILAGTRLPRGTKLSVTSSGRCRVNRNTWPCAIAPLPQRQRLALLSRGSPPRTGEGTILLGGGVLFLAALLGLVISRDLARDLDHVARQIHEMATADRVDLSKAIPVASLDEVGELIEAVGALRTRLTGDLHSYTGALDRAHEAQKENSVFIANVSHELHTPLRDLADRTQGLIDGAEGEFSPAQGEDLVVIHKSSQQLFGLINDVLDMSVLETGTLTLTLEDVDIAELCHEAFEQQEAIVRSGRAAKIHLEAIIDDDLPLIHADARRILQILQNLLSNAIKFTREGTVSLRASSPDDTHGTQVIIEIEDTGEGIGTADQAEIFEEYRQAGGIRSRRGGTGLGLAISKRLVDLHGGTIDLQSEIGSGSCFRIKLPVDGPPGATE